MQRIFFAGFWRIWLGCCEAAVQEPPGRSLKVGNDRERLADVATSYCHSSDVSARSVVTSPINSSTAGGGRAIHISSYGGPLALAGNSMYHARKWAIGLQTQVPSPYHFLAFCTARIPNRYRLRSDLSSK
jgi:hypothetical protein